MELAPGITVGTTAETGDAVKYAAMAEANKRGILPPDKQAAFQEAQKRGLIGGAPEKPTSQALGFEESVTNIFDRAAKGLHFVINAATPGSFIPGHHGLADQIDSIASAAGMPTVDQATQKHQEYFAGREQKEQPGGWGAFAGDIVGTLPLAATGAGPFMGGAAAGALSGHGETPSGVGGDALAGGIGGKILHGATGWAARKVAPYLRNVPERASDYVDRLMTSSKKTLGDLANSTEKHFGKPVTAAEVLGRSGKTATRALAVREGETGDLVEGDLGVRNEGRPERLKDDFIATTGINPEAAQGNLDTIVATGRKEARPLYDLAFAQPMKNAPYVSVVEHNLNEAGKAKAAAQAAVQEAERNLTYAEAKLQKAGDNVYGVNSANEEKRAAEKALSEAERKFDRTEKDHAELKSDLDHLRRDLGTEGRGAGYTSRLGQFLSNPLIRRGMQHGIMLAKQDALAEGVPFNEHEFAVVGQDENGLPKIGPVPTWRSWDAAKHGIDKVLDEMRNPFTGKLPETREVQSILGMRKAFVNELDKANPHYATARARAGDYMSAREAYDRGAKAVFNQGLTEKQFLDMTQRMSKTDLEALKGGVANTLFNKGQTGALKPTLLKTPRMLQKMGILFGPDKAQQIADRFKIEKEMQEFENWAPPGKGSSTAGVLKTHDDQAGATEVVRDLAHASVYSVAGMKHAAGYRFASALTKGVALLRTADMPVEVRNEVGKMLMMTPEELADHLKDRPEQIKVIQGWVLRAQNAAGLGGAIGAAHGADQFSRQDQPGIQ